MYFTFTDEYKEQLSGQKWWPMFTGLDWEKSKKTNRKCECYSTEMLKDYPRPSNGRTSTLKDLNY